MTVRESKSTTKTARDFYLNDSAQRKAKKLIRDMDKIIKKTGELIIVYGHDENDWDEVAETLNKVPEGKEYQFMTQLIKKAKTEKGWEMFYLNKIAEHFNKNKHSESVMWLSF